MGGSRAFANFLSLSAKQLCVSLLPIHSFVVFPSLPLLYLSILISLLSLTSLSPFHIVFRALFSRLLPVGRKKKFIIDQSYLLLIKALYLYIIRFTFSFAFRMSKFTVFAFALLLIFIVQSPIEVKSAHENDHQQTSGGAEKSANNFPKHLKGVWVSVKEGGEFFSTLIMYIFVKYQK